MVYQLALPEILCFQLVQKVIPYFFLDGKSLLVQKLQALTLQLCCQTLFVISEFSLKTCFWGVKRRQSYLNLYKIVMNIIAGVTVPKLSGFILRKQLS